MELVESRLPICERASKQRSGMATLVIRNVEPKLHTRLKLRAAARGHSMEEEARQLLRQGLTAEPAPPSQTFGSAVRALFEPLGGVELPSDLRPRGGRPPPDFSEPQSDETG
jgi:plasmid stability protein